MPALHTAGRAKVYVETLGCSKNRVDSEIMLHHLSQNHYTLTLEPQEADAIVVNTCAFLTSATEESVQRILELSEFKETGRCSTLVAAGCLSQRYREDLLKELPELDALLGSQDFSEIVPLLDQVRREPGKQHSFVQPKPHYQQFEDQEKQQSTPRHFAYVKIAEGCSNMCSFCNIPMLRGLLSSRSVPSIVNEVQQLVSRGVKEINLISQDTSSFGRDRGQLELAELLRSISALEGNFWVRLFYCYPNTFTDNALAAFAADKRFCAYLDMPFQHIEDNVLRKMNRKITRSQIEQKMQEVKRVLPEVAWRTTFIVGFPTETEEAFEELLEFVAAGHFTHVGVFTYSPEDNIRSARLGDAVPNAVKHERKQRLMEVQRQVSQQRNQARVGQVLPVLVDGYAEETELLLQGRAAFQGPEVDGLVYINEGNARPGIFHSVEITEAHDYDLVGKIIE